MGKVSTELGQRIYIDTNIVIYAIEGLALNSGCICAA